MNSSFLMVLKLSERKESSPCFFNIFHDIFECFPPIFCDMIFLSHFLPFSASLLDRCPKVIPNSAEASSVTKFYLFRYTNTLPTILLTFSAFPYSLFEKLRLQVQFDQNFSSEEVHMCVMC